MSQFNTESAPKAGPDVVTMDLSGEELARLDLGGSGIFLLPILWPGQPPVSTPFTPSSVADEEFPQTPEPDLGIDFSDSGIGLGIDLSAMSISVSFSDVASEGEPAGFKVRQSHQCRWCGREFDQSSMLKQHIRRHTRPVRCEQSGCSASFATKRDMFRHLATHHSARHAIQDNAGFCELCGKHFTRRDNLRRHQHRTHSHNC
jgi:hypothetical protein